MAPTADDLDRRTDLLIALQRTVTYTGGTGSDTIDLSTKARVYGGSIFDFVLTPSPTA